MSMKKGEKIVLISMGAIGIAMALFIAYQIIAFYHYKSIVLDRFPVEPPPQEERRFFEMEKERKEEAIELAKAYARQKDDLYGDAQNFAEKMKGDLKIIGWDAERAIHAGTLYDSERFGARLLNDFERSMEIIKKGLIKLKDLGFLREGSPASELLLEGDPKYFASRIRRLKEEYVSIQFYLLPRGKGIMKAKDLSEEAKSVVDEIDQEIEKASSLIKHFYHYGDSTYLVSFRYQTQEDRLKDRTQGWFFEVDLETKTVRDASLDKDLSRKYLIPLRHK